MREYWFLCLYMGVYIHVYWFTDKSVCVCMCVCTHVWGVHVGYMSTDAILRNAVHFLEERLPENLHIRIDRLASRSYGTFCFCLPNLYVTNMYHHLWCFYLNSGTWTQVFLLEKWGFTDWSISKHCYWFLSINSVYWQMTVLFI